MTTELLEEKIKRIISDRLSVELDQITNEKKFNELGADSLDVVDMLVEIEREFSINIPDQHMEKLNTVQNLIEYITQKVN